jgi:hypothetical protein
MVHIFKRKFNKLNKLKIKLKSVKNNSIKEILLQYKKNYQKLLNYKKNGKNKNKQNNKSINMAINL